MDSDDEDLKLAIALSLADDDGPSVSHAHSKPDQGVIDLVSDTEDDEDNDLVRSMSTVLNDTSLRC